MKIQHTRNEEDAAMQKHTYKKVKSIEKKYFCIFIRSHSNTSS